VTVAADYPFLDLMWTMIVVVAWILWIWLVVSVLTDLFRRHDASWAKKVVWTLAILFLPLLGVLVYLIANGDGMAARSARREREMQARRGKMQVQRHIKKQQDMSKKLWDLAKRAMVLGEERQFQQLGNLHHGLMRHIAQPLVNDVQRRQRHRLLGRIARKKRGDLLHHVVRQDALRCDHRSSSAAMMFKLPSTATTSLSVWPRIRCGKTAK
jgi:hypothetical protein